MLETIQLRLLFKNDLDIVTRGALKTIKPKVLDEKKQKISYKGSGHSIIFKIGLNEQFLGSFYRKMHPGFFFFSIFSGCVYTSPLFL